MIKGTMLIIIGIIVSVQNSKIVEFKLRYDTECK